MYAKNVDRNLKKIWAKDDSPNQVISLSVKDKGVEQPLALPGSANY